MAHHRARSVPLITVLCFAVRNQHSCSPPIVHPRRVRWVVIPLAAEQRPRGRPCVEPRSSRSRLDLAAHDLRRASVWVGGLLTVVLLRRQLDAGSASRARLASAAAAVLDPGTCWRSSSWRRPATVSAAVRLGDLRGAAHVVRRPGARSRSCALGITRAVRRATTAGVLDRQGDPGRRRSRAVFWILRRVAELAFMGVASGVAAALGAHGDAGPRCRPRPRSRRPS